MQIKKSGLPQLKINYNKTKKAQAMLWRTFHYKKTPSMSKMGFP